MGIETDGGNYNVALRFLQPAGFSCALLDEDGFLRSILEGILEGSLWYEN
jgi:hypothetical protein